MIIDAVPLNHRLNFAKTACPVQLIYAQSQGRSTPSRNRSVQRAQLHVKSKKPRMLQNQFHFLNRKFKMVSLLHARQYTRPFHFLWTFILEILSLFIKCGTWDIKFSLVIYCMTIVFEGLKDTSYKLSIWSWAVLCFLNTQTSQVMTLKEILQPSCWPIAESWVTAGFWNSRSWLHLEFFGAVELSST